MNIAMDLQPTLTGASILLRPLYESDRDALYAVASDPLVWALHPAHDRHEPEVFRAFFDDALASGGALVVIDRRTCEIIGSSRYGFGRAELGEIEVGWTFLARTYWGGAVNAEVKRLMLAYVFNWVDAVIFLVGESNLRSRRALEKIGARLTTRTHRAVLAGAEVVHVIYAMSRAEFALSPLMEDL